MLSFEKFVEVANHMAGYLHTKVSRVFNDEGNYKAVFKECDAFDRLSMTGRASSKTVAVNRAGRTWTFEVR